MSCEDWRLAAIQNHDEPGESRVHNHSSKKGRSYDMLFGGQVLVSAERVRHRISDRKTALSPATTNWINKKQFSGRKNQYKSTMYLPKITTGAGWKSEIRRKVLPKKLRLCRSLLHVCKQDLLPCFETYLVNKSFLQYLSIALYVWNMNTWRCFLSASVSNLAGNLLLFFLLVGHEGKDRQGVWCKSLGGQLYNLKYYESSKVTWDLIFL